MDENEEKINEEAQMPEEPILAPAAEPVMDAEMPPKKYIIKNKVVREILSWILTILLAMLIAIIINTYFFRISRVSGHSMQQTYQDGEIVFISRAPYLFGDAKKNDIIIFDSEFKERNFLLEVKEAFKYNIISYKFFDVEQPQNYYIKRVVAVAGDTLQIKEDGVYVNGSRLDESYVNPEEEPRYGNVSDALKNGITIPDGKVFAMGDNRNHSTDSRAIGLVPVGDIIGKVIGG